METSCPLSGPHGSAVNEEKESEPVSPYGKKSVTVEHRGGPVTHIDQRLTHSAMERNFITSLPLIDALPGDGNMWLNIIKYALELRRFFQIIPYEPNSPPIYSNLKPALSHHSHYFGFILR